MISRGCAASTAAASPRRTAPTRGNPPWCAPHRRISTMGPRMLPRSESAGISTSRPIITNLSNLLEMEAVLRRRWGDSGDGQQRGKKMDLSCTISDSLSLRSAFPIYF
ncbi:hypothetical protein OROMI_025201 [Orobanche minor]